MKNGASKFWLGILFSLSIALTAVGFVPVAIAQEETPAEPSPSVQPVSSGIGGKQPLELATQNPAVQPVSQNFELSADKHPWTKFPLGAWREIEITSDSSNETVESISRSVTTQIEKLEAFSGQQYTLQVQSTLNVVGKQVVGPFVTRVLNSSTDHVGDILLSRRLDDQILALPLGSTNCEVWEVAYQEDARNLTDRIFFAPQQFPYVLRRETTAEPSDPNLPPALEEVVTIVAKEVPYTVGTETKLCSCLQTVRHGQKGSTVVISMLNESVPGGEVAVWTTEFDLQGARTRWSTQKLVSHGLTPRVEKPLTRRELRRARRNR